MQWTDEDKRLMWLLFERTTSSEAWGDLSKMHPSILFLVDKFRTVLPHGYWLKIHCGYKASSLMKNRYHHKGRAVDFHVVGCSLVEAERHLMRFLNDPFFVDNKKFKLIEFVGVGIYPDWNDPGFHLDTRGSCGTWSKVNGEYVSYDVGLKEAKTRNL